MKVLIKYSFLIFILLVNETEENINHRLNNNNNYTIYNNMKN